jgi:Dullard-like phosphatase family protein
MPNGNSAKAGFNIRPYWKEMMDAIKKDWEVVVFTASCKNYADTILDYLDPNNEYFQHRFYRDTCWKVPDGVYVKDLRVFHQWNLKDIILIDNAVYSFAFQLDNGIPIIPYYKGKDDKQLLYLKEYLELIVDKDIIKDLKRTFMSTELSNMDLDKIVDRYCIEEDNDENEFDILDKMFEQQLIREKSQSFNTYLLNGRHSTEGISQMNVPKIEEEKLMVVNPNEDEVSRSHSSNFICQKVI